MSNWKFLFIIYGILAIVAMLISCRANKYYTQGYESGVKDCWEEVETSNDDWWVATIRRQMNER